MSRSPRLLLAAAVITALAVANHVAAQTGGCPPGRQPATEPDQDGGRIEYCQGPGGPSDRHDGPIRAFYAGGQKQFEGEFRDGKPYGRWLGWYRSGRPEGEADFGSCEFTRLVAWYQDGKPFYELDPTTQQARIFDRNGRELPLEGFSGPHPEFVRLIMLNAFLLGKVCPPRGIVPPRGGG